MPEHAPGDLLTDKAAGAYIGGIPVGTLRQWRYLGLGPPFVKVGAKHVRYRRSDLDRWLADQTVTPPGASS
jgi:hypothetical protein